ncbi:MAG: hypothetical protein OEZ36_07780, partial [Spirochaetota bacterium]|nr:hypothetical protein [Spirochaetota bacterium]
MLRFRRIIPTVCLILLVMTQGFAGVSEWNLADEKTDSQDKVIYDKWNKELSIISPISKRDYAKKTRGLLLYLYEKKLLEDLQKEGLLEGDIKRNAGSSYWKRKYLAFISKRAKQTPDEVDDAEYLKPEKFNLVIIVRDI